MNLLLARLRRIALGLPLVVSLIACAAPPRADAVDLPEGVRAALRRAQVPPEAFGALVVPLDGGAPRLVHRPQAAVNPASVMKLVTTYAAIDLLGADHTWTTRFATDGTIEGNALRGNLYIRGGGDPKLVIERVQAAYAALQAQGVLVILGDMVLDHSAFELPAADPAAFDGEALRPYNASPDALLVNFKSVILRFVPDAQAGVARVLSEPPLAGLRIDASVPLDKGPCGDWRGGLRARFDDPERIAFEGRYPLRCGEGQWPVAYQDPGSYAARALEGLWRASGGLITGRARTGLTPPGVSTLLDAPSLPLAEIITDVNQWSNNVMAQQVFLSLGRLPPAPTAQAAAGPAPRASFDRARSVLRDWWARRFGAALPAPVLDNGSGLSRDERITPEALAALLRQAAHHAQGEAFVHSLSLAGVSGTARRLAQDPGSAAHARAWLKTGTLRDVSGVAGYVDAVSGGRFVVVGIINHPNAPAARAALDALIDWAARLE